MLVSTYKAQAKRLGTHLHAKHGVALKHSALLEAVSALHGYSDWNTLSGLNKRADADRQEEWLEPLVSCKTLRELAICLARERLVSSDLLSAPHLMQSVSEDQKIWEGKALRAWSALVLCLQCRYQFESVLACVNAVYAHLSFDAMFELYRYAQSEAGRDAERWGEYLALMCHYFDALPGFDAEKDNQSLATIDQHNYRVAYLVSLLTPLQQSRLKGGGDVFVLSGKEKAKEGTPPLVTIAPDDSHLQNSFQRSAAIALAINSHVPPIHELKLPHIEQWLEQIINDRGKIHLVAGNSNSGRTTTLYSTAQALVNRGYSVAHISTHFEYGKESGVTSIHYDYYEGDPLSFVSAINETKPDFVITTFDLKQAKDIRAINELCRKEGITFVVEAFGANSQKARDFLTGHLEPNSVLLDSSVLYHQFSLDNNKQPQRDINLFYKTPDATDDNEIKPFFILRWLEKLTASKTGIHLLASRVESTRTNALHKIAAHLSSRNYRVHMLSTLVGETEKSVASYSFFDRVDQVDDLCQMGADYLLLDGFTLNPSELQHLASLCEKKGVGVILSLSSRSDRAAFHYMHERVDFTPLPISTVFEINPFKDNKGVFISRVSSGKNLTQDLLFFPRPYRDPSSLVGAGKLLLTSDRKSNQGNGGWELKALQAWTALVLCLYYQGVSINVNMIRDNLPFDAMFELYQYAHNEAKKTDMLWNENLEPINNYFHSLPGFDAKKDKEKQSQLTVEQHNYRIAYLIDLLSPLQGYSPTSHN